METGRAPEEDRRNSRGYTVSSKMKKAIEDQIRKQHANSANEKLKIVSSILGIDTLYENPEESEVNPGMHSTGNLYAFGLTLLPAFAP